MKNWFIKISCSFSGSRNPSPSHFALLPKIWIPRIQWLHFNPSFIFSISFIPNQQQEMSTCTSPLFNLNIFSKDFAVWDISFKGSFNFVSDYFFLGLFFSFGFSGLFAPFLSFAALGFFLNSSYSALILAYSLSFSISSIFCFVVVKVGSEPMLLKDRSRTINPLLFSKASEINKAPGYVISFQWRSKTHIFWFLFSKLEICSAPQFVTLFLDKLSSVIC